jgi:hypothetical protein
VREPATQSQGSVGAQQLAPGVMLFKMSGYLDTSFVERFESEVAVMAAHGVELELFFDTESMTGDHPDFRRRMTEWHNLLKPRTRALHVLVRSKLVAMSIAFVNVLTGGMLKTYTNRVSFETVLRAAVRRARVGSGQGRS